MTPRRSFLNPMLCIMALLLCSLATAADRAPANEPAKIEFTISPANPVLRSCQSPQIAYLKVGLRGESKALEVERAPVNVAIVLDRSGSMSGEKIQQARQAAKMFVDRLGPEDIVAIVSYSDTVEVVVPAQPLRNPGAAKAAINGIRSGGNTALFAGVSHGAAMVRSHLSDDRVNRVLLLSDGLANQGPSTPQELGQLGESLAMEGITVSTIGLGLDYNEDLMNLLAAKGDGSPAFAQEPQDLAKFFDRELRTITNVIAQDVDVTVSFPDGVRPIRVLGDRGSVVDGEVHFGVAALYQNWEDSFVVEVELPDTAVGAVLPVAAGSANWRDMATVTRQNASAKASIKFAATEEDVAKALDEDAMGAVVELLASERSLEAVRLRDQGLIAEARAAIQQNIDFIQQNAAQMPSQQGLTEELLNYNQQDMQQIDQDEEWGASRKEMKTRSQGDIWRVKQ
ncbi:VWA domain-containing protein [bacterium]|nr:VWA domain-containing protein [bacterium]